jgi:hypothetical protein
MIQLLKSICEMAFLKVANIKKLFCIGLMGGLFRVCCVYEFVKSSSALILFE